MIRCLALVCTMVILVAGCQSREERTYIAPMPNNVPPGSTFTLEQDLRLPADGRPVYFQDAEVVAQHSLQSGYPYCEFQSQTAPSAVLTLNPQVFTVLGSTLDERASAVSGAVISATTISMSSAKSPEQFALTCLPAQASSMAQFVTPEEIIGAVGTILKFEQVE